MTSYWERLTTITADRGSLCVGIDPHPELLGSWGLRADASGLERFVRSLVAETGDLVAVYKPQSAFFESYGSAGIAVLERLLSDIAAVGALSIMDAKRGDIGSTMEAYAQAYLADGSPLAADALTVSPFLGLGSLAPAFEQAHRCGRGVYVLARTSNPEGSQVQLALGPDGSRTVAQELIDEATALNQASEQRAIGIVVGGTHSHLGVQLDAFNGSILVPGIGAQGGRLEDLPALFGNALGQVLPMAGRAILGAGPDRQALRDAVARHLAPIGSSR